MMKSLQKFGVTVFFLTDLYMDEPLETIYPLIHYGSIELVNIGSAEIDLINVSNKMTISNNKTLWRIFCYVYRLVYVVDKPQVS